MKLIVSIVCLCIANAFRSTHVNKINRLQMLFQSTKSTGPIIPSNKKVCVITGTSSGLGKETAKALLNKDDYFVICAVRDVEKMKQIAEIEGFDKKKYTIVECELASLESTKKFVKDLKKISPRPLDRLVCNAAVYQPALPTVSYITIDIFFTYIIYMYIYSLLFMYTDYISYNTMIFYILTLIA